jgi:DNA-binding MarR family transcriptional regulator
MKDKKVAQKVEQFCRNVLRLHHQIHISQIRFLAAVARHSPDGATQTAISKELGVSVASVSRLVDVFGPSTYKDRSGRPGFGFVQKRRDRADDRVKVVSITETGLVFLNSLVS